MLMVGLTGGIATGKSLVSALLKEQGAAIVDTDEVYHDLLRTNVDLLMAIRSAFGPQYFDAEGRLDRRKLAGHVFGKPEELQKLNRICHPVIIDETMARVDRLFERNTALPLVFLAIPLLFEVKLQDLVDKSVLVYATRRQQFERLKAREGLSDEEVEKRLASQMPIDEKKKLADIVIDNSGTVEETTERVRTVLDKLARESVQVVGKGRRGARGLS